MKILSLFITILIPWCLFSQDTLYNDVIITKLSKEKKVAIISEDRSIIRYYEVINGKVYKKNILKKDIYAYRPDGMPMKVLSHSKIKRYGDYFVLDKNGVYLGLNIGGGYAHWQEHNSGSILKKNTGNTTSFGLEFGARFYFRSSFFKYTHGISIGLRADGIVGNGVGIFSPTPFVGYTSVYKLNKTQALEFGLKIGTAIFIDDIGEDYFMPVFYPIIAVDNGVTGIASVRYRFKRLSVGVEYLNTVARSIGFDYVTASRQSLAISMGIVF